jgi:ketosteroid isomerase-like protein
VIAIYWPGFKALVSVAGTEAATMAGLSSLDLDELRDFPRYWERLFEDGDQRQIAAHYTPDGQLVATGLPTVVGRDAIESFWRLAIERTAAAGLRRAVRLDHVEKSGSLGYMRGFVEVCGPGVSTVTRYVTVWRREPDGLWRLAVDISCNQPQPVEEFQQADQFGCVDSAPAKLCGLDEL